MRHDFRTPYVLLTSQLSELDRMIAENPEAVEEIAALAAEVDANNAELGKLMGKKAAADAIAEQLNDCQSQLAETQAQLDAVAEAADTLLTAATDKVTAARQELTNAMQKLSALGDYDVILQNILNAKKELFAAQANYDALK